MDNIVLSDQTVEMEPLSLTELGRRIGARWLTLAVLGAIGLAAGIAFHLVSPTTYRAESIIRVDATDPALVDMAAERALAASRQVTTEALASLDQSGLTVEKLENATAVKVLPDSRVLQISYDAGTPGAAARGANAVANAYLAVRAVDVRRRADVEAKAVSTADMIDPARTPQSPVGLSLGICAIAGLMLGLLVALPIAARPPRKASQPVE